MSPQTPTQQDVQDDGKQLRAIPSIHLVTEEGNQEDAQQPEHSTDNPSTAQPDMQVTSQQHEKTDSAPTNPAERSSPPNPPSATPLISSLGRPPLTSKHHYLKEMWPGQPICHLCHKQYKKTNRAIRALPCGDIFHRACVDHLLGQKDGRCPSCELPIPAEWYMPHKYDRAKPAGSPCLCHPVSRNGMAAKMNANSEGESSTSPGVPDIRKTLKRTMEAVIRCTVGRRPKRKFVNYKMENGQTRYVESEMGVGLPGSRSGRADG